MILSEWTQCPECEFPAIQHHFSELLTKTGQCPMCYASITPEQLVLMRHAEQELRDRSNLLQDDFKEQTKIIEEDKKDVLPLGQAPFPGVSQDSFASGKLI